MDDTVSGGPAILEALQQTAMADSWVQDRMQEFRNKSMREAAQLKNLDQVSRHAKSNRIAGKRLFVDQNLNFN